MPTRIYHITHLKNLPSILLSGGLLSHNRLQQTQTRYSDISYEQIQGRRATKQVPCGAGGVLHDYVPFYFAPRSPMLSAIHNGKVSGCPEGQTPILHLVTTAEAVEAAGLSFAFSDGHAVVDYSDFYDSLDCLDAIDWKIMEARIWRDTNTDGDRKRRRQAEFLIHGELPWSLMIGIGVISTQIQEEVEQVLQNFNLTTPVRIRSDWYYS